MQINRINHLTITGTLESNELIHIFGRYTSNAIHIIDNNSNESIGIGVYFKFSFINHSCYPNCIIKFDNNKIIKVISIKPISKGEMICFNYLTEIKPFQERRDTLKSLYYFDCNCELCEIEKKENNSCVGCEKEENSKNIITSDIINKINEIINIPIEKTNIQIVYNKTKQIFDLIHSILEDKPSIYYIIIINRILYLCSLLKNNNDIVKYCQLSYISLLKYYPPLHPIIGKRYLCHANALVTVGNYSESKTYYMKSKIIFRNIEGNESDYVKSIDQVLNLINNK